MPHPDPLRLEAYFDAELDALSMIDIERHLAQCAGCSARLEELVRIRNALRRSLPPMPVPADLRARVLRGLDGVSPVQRPWRARPLWIGALGGGLVTALAASLVMLAWLPPRANPVADELVGAHLRALMADHLIDVASSDRHTVKPWFAGHADVSPVVVDFTADGYPLSGGRADYVDRRRAAVVVYRHGAHVIDVFAWSGDARRLPDGTMRDGYRLICWRAADLDYCAVSDTADEELRGLVGLLQAHGAGRSPE